MKLIFSILFILGCGFFSNAQDAAALLREAGNKLSEGSVSVSDLLTHPSYLNLHPETGFRQLVKQYAGTTPIKIATTQEPGKKIKVLGQVKNSANQPLAAVLVYVYQTDSKGWYAADRPHVGGNEGDRRHARLFGYVKTDKEGKFELQTIKPSGYPSTDLPAHIHVEILDLDGYRPLITEFLFDDDERLAGEIRSRAFGSGFLLAKPEKTNSPFEQLFSYTLVLQKK